MSIRQRRAGRVLACAVLGLGLGGALQAQYQVGYEGANRFWVVNETSQTIGSASTVSGRVQQAAHALCLAAGWSYFRAVAANVDRGEQAQRILVGYGRKASATLDLEMFDEPAEGRTECKEHAFTPRIGKKIENQLRLLNYRKPAPEPASDPAPPEVAAASDAPASAGPPPPPTVTTEAQRIREGVWLLTATAEVAASARPTDEEILRTSLADVCARTGSIGFRRIGAVEIAKDEELKAVWSILGVSYGIATEQTLSDARLEVPLHEIVELGDAESLESCPGS